MQGRDTSPNGSSQKIDTSKVNLQSVLSKQLSANIEMQDLKNK